MNQALGTDNLEALAARVQQLVKPEIPTTLIEKMKRLPDLIKMAGFPPKVVRSGICQQVVLEGRQGRPDASCRSSSAGRSTGT